MLREATAAPRPPTRAVRLTDLTSRAATALGDDTTHLLLTWLAKTAPQP